MGLKIVKNVMGSGTLQTYGTPSTHFDYLQYFCGASAMFTEFHGSAELSLKMADRV